MRRIRPGLPAALSRFGRQREGATAVEFALVVGPFLLAILATMEVAMVLWTGEVLENAVTKASRKIYTGEFQNNSADQTPAQLQTKLRDMICDEVGALVKCSDIAIDVTSPGSFASLTIPEPIVDGSYNTSSYGYKKIEAKQIGLVTASLQYKTFFPPLADKKLANGNRVIIATAVFRTEPYAPN